MGESPSSCKVSRPDFFIDVHLQRVIVASAKDSENPSKHDVAVVAALNEGGESQNCYSSHEKSALAEILFRNSALHRVVDDDGAKYEAADKPG